MNTTLLFAAALVIRSLLPADGIVECPVRPGQQIVAAYSAEFEPIWHHAVPTTIVDRVAAARTGKVTGLGPSDRLVIALADENAVFDTSRPLFEAPDTFPYAPDFVRAYEKHTGRPYVRDMMVVVAPNLGSQWARAVSVTELYETIFASAAAREAFRTFGSGEAGSVLVVTSRARVWCWLDKCFGDDGSAYAKSLAAKGYRVDLADWNAFARLTVDADGFVTANGRRYKAMVLRHLSIHDADDYRRTFGTRPLKTKVYSTDAPLLFGAEITWSDPTL